MSGCQLLNRNKRPDTTLRNIRDYCQHLTAMSMLSNAGNNRCEKDEWEDWRHPVTPHTLLSFPTQGAELKLSRNRWSWVRSIRGSSTCANRLSRSLRSFSSIPLSPAFSTYFITLLSFLWCGWDYLDAIALYPHQADGTNLWQPDKILLAFLNWRKWTHISGKGAEAFW